MSSPFSEKLAPSPVVNIENDTIWLGREKKLTPDRWGLVKEGHFKGVSLTVKELDPGVYSITKDDNDGAPVFIRKEVVHDNIIELQGLPKDVSDEIQAFWGKDKVFKERGFLHRRGYLLYGSHGTGKSSLVHQIVDRIIKEKGIVFYCEDPKNFNDGLALFRQIEPTRKIVCVFEDVDALVRKYGEAMLLSILDGENQISGVCNIATTNYPELLDKRIVGRPRRFDRVHRIGNMDDKARKAFLEKKLPEMPEKEFNQWVKKTDGLSIAAISEVIISVFCFEKKIDDAVGIVKTLAEDKSSDEYKEGKIGFGEE